MKSSITVDVTKLPEVLWAVRKEFAAALREEAADEQHPHTARRLNEIAAKFEVGQCSN